MLRYTSKAHSRWERWFRENGDERLDVPISGPGESTIGQLDMHIFGPKLRFTQLLRNEPKSNDRNLPDSSIDQVFGFGSSEWDGKVDIPASRFTVRRLIAHAVVHDLLLTEALE